MILIQEVKEIHKTLIDTFGGSHGIRDLPALESALARPFQTFDDKDLHPTPLHKAASLIESILINHPFIDGNKRTGYVLMRILLIDNEWLRYYRKPGRKICIRNKHCFRPNST
ncbi:MAG: Fic family protein [Bacteroidota bacterium]|nr:Fic family protein [Bacteroidota bacterium]